MKCSPSADCSRESEALNLDSSEQVCRFCGTAKPTSSVSTSSVSGGRESRVFPTCAISWPTPDAGVFNIGETYEGWMERNREHAKRYNRKDFRPPLGVAVKNPACECRCHTSMSSAAGSPAKTSALPDAGQASKGPGRVFGGSSLGSLGNYDPATSSLRTSQLSLLEDLTGSLSILPRSGSMRNGTVYRHQPLAPLTGGTGSGSSRIPTPTVGDSKSAANATAGRLDPDSKHHSGTTLTDFIRMWPTPRTSDTNGPGRHGQGGLDLRTAVAETSPSGGQLNPMWVEWLMGFPLGWTVSERWETRSSRRSQSGSAGASSRGKSSES